MRSLFATFLFVFSIILVNAQSTTAVCNSKANLIKGVESGLIQMTLPETSTKDDIEKYAAYYKNAFTVDYDEKSHLATIKMVENTSSNRRVIVRFLSANQIQNVVVEGKSFIMSDFYENFLK